MLANKSSKLLRAALMSKLSIQQSSQVPILTQAVVKVKAEHSFDTINNVCLLSSIVGSKSQVVLVNTKKSVLHPRVLLTKQLLSNFISAELPQILHRAVDKVTAVSYASLSNKLTFTFKASDAMSSNVRKLWKVLETEVGLFEVEMTFVSNLHNSVANESLLRSNQIPVVLNI